MAAAAKVSNIAAIDPVMNRVRAITARQTTTSKLDAKDESQLRKVYQEVEQYLVETDPVRRYTREELRRRLAVELKLGSAKTILDSPLD